MGGCFILSRTISGAIKVSTQSVVLNAGANSDLALFTSESAFRAAADSYGLTDANFLASGYQGQQGGGVETTQRLVSLTIGDTEVTNVAREVANRTNFGDVTPYTITANFAQPVTSASYPVFFTGGVGIELEVESINGNVVTLNARPFNEELGRATFTAFSIVADGETFTL